MTKKNVKKRTISYYKSLGRISGGLVAVLLAASLILPDKAVSEAEKRTLASLPELNLNSLSSGFCSDFEDYASDQIAGRNFFVRLYSAFSSLMGSDSSNGVYKCSDDYLIEKMTVNDTFKTERTIETINTFVADYDIPASFVMVPNAISIYSDKLPAFAVTEDQQEWSTKFASQLKGLNYLDLSAYLTGDRLYYKTDHHWTSYACYKSLEPVLNALSHDTAGEMKYQASAICNDFSGSLASKSGYTTGSADTIYVFAPEKECSYIVTDMSTRQKSATIYNLDGLNSSDPYTVFLGGNSARINIVTENKDGAKLLVFKDSYFNSFLPFLIDKYQEIDIIDARYYYDDLRLLMLEKNYDEVLFFYNMNTFVNDTSLCQVLEVAANE